jgi:hypothetical protein
MSTAASITNIDSAASKSRKPKESLASLKVKEREIFEEVKKYDSEFQDSQVNVSRKQIDYLSVLQAFKDAQKEEKATAARLASAKLDMELVRKKIDIMEKKEVIDKVEKQEKKDLALAKKNMPKGVYSEDILTKIVAKCPSEIIAIIGEYLTVECLNNVLSFDLYRKIHNIGVADMIRGFRRSIRNRPEYLTLISRKEARGHFNTIRGVPQPKENKVEPAWMDDIFQSIIEVKMNIYDIIVKAKVGNPLFAFKMLKTIAVLNKNKKLLRRNFIFRNMPQLTEFYLPAEYL